MSMTLYLWKAPVVDDPDEAARLVERYDDGEGDRSVFEPSEVLAEIEAELLRRFPDAEDGPWADGPLYSTDRLLTITIRWGADNAVLDAISELAHEHELVLYDPQGPDVGLVDDPAEREPVPPMTVSDYVKFLPMLAAAVGVFWLGWWIEVPVLNWILRIVGGFFITVILFMFWIFIFEKDDDLEK